MNRSIIEDLQISGGNADSAFGLVEAKKRQCVLHVLVYAGNATGATIHVQLKPVRPDRPDRAIDAKRRPKKVEETCS